MDEVTSNQVQNLEEKKAAINEQMAELVEVDQMSNEQILSLIHISEPTRPY